MLIDQILQESDFQSLARTLTLEYDLIDFSSSSKFYDQKWNQPCQKTIIVLSGRRSMETCASKINSLLLYYKLLAASTVDCLPASRIRWTRRESGDLAEKLSPFR
jgi:hypothetical protein